VIRKITRISTARNGRMARAIVVTRSPDTAEATNSTSPIGGVASPTVRFTHMMMAKCTLSTPSWVKTGARIGPRMMIAGPASRNMPTTTLLTDVLEALGLHSCGAVNRCLATLGAGQIDRFGNINSSWNADGSFIVGSGGANDIANAACETLIVANQRTRTFVEKVDFKTSPGDRVRVLVSTMGRYEKREGDELVLTGVFQSAGASREDVVAKIRERCGWELLVADDLEWLSPATDEELATLRVFDPERSFLGKGMPRD